jgi:hypothetical protein
LQGHTFEHSQQAECAQVKPLLIVVAVFCTATLVRLAAVMAEPVPTVQDFLSGRSNTLGVFIQCSLSMVGIASAT